MSFHWKEPERLPDPAVELAYARYLARKRVVLVGPAPSIEGSRQRDLIESHDVVVRINHALPIPRHLQDDVGRRTDVLYHNLWHANPRGLPLPQLVELLDGCVQWVSAAYPYSNLDHAFATDIDLFVAQLRGRVPLHVPDTARYLSTWRDIGTRPNAGVSAIADLLSFDIARLYITGFTFYGGSRVYHTGYQGSAQGIGTIHDQGRQREYIARTLQSDGRLAVDRVLEEILAVSPPGVPHRLEGESG
jgi:hypothetical protein